MSRRTPMRDPRTAATERIAELELVRDSLARKLADAITECEQLRIELARRDASELAGANA